MSGFAEHNLANAKRILAYPPAFRRGISQLIKPVAPAAGSNFTYKVSADYWERILTVAFTFTAVGNGQQRNLSMQFQDGDGFVFNQEQISTNILNAGAFSYFADMQPVAPVLANSGLVGEGSVAAPAAGTTIASVTSTAGGTYDIYVTITLSGTLAAGTDNNNLQAFNGGVLNYGIFDNSIQLTPQTFGPIRVTLPAAGAFIVKNIGAASAGSVYSVYITATPVSVSNQFNLPDLILPSGFQIQLVASNIQAGDTFTAVGLFLERYGSKYSHGGYELEEREALQEIYNDAMAGRW